MATTAACICEQDDKALLLYRSIEYGFDLSENVMEWLPAAVARTEAVCPARFHYAGIMYDEWLSADVTTSSDDPDADAVEFWEGQDSDHQDYMHRCEESAADFEAKDDYTTLIRSREMAKKRELRDTMVRLGLDPREQAAWVRERIVLKRQDAIREKQRAEKASHYTEGFPLPQESQIRLRAYASCIASLKKRHG